LDLGMSHESAEVVICGAGIAGISTAYHLAVHHGLKNVVLVDELPPMSLTSDKSTECYRNWWPGPGDAMVALMNRSIDLLEGWAETTGNAIQLNRRGYLFATADPAKAGEYLAISREAESHGAGPLRVYHGGADDPTYEPSPAEGYPAQLTGADLLLDPNLIQKTFPYLSPATVAVLHARRCGWFSGQQLGAWLLAQARQHGARLVNGRIDSVEVDSGIRSVHVTPDLTLATERFVVAAGPKAPQVAGLLGVELPIFCELHAKVSVADPQGIIPRDAPLVIWSDPQRLDWTSEERQALAEEPETGWLLEEMPAGVHMRPEGLSGSPMVLMLWTYDLDPVVPVFPPDFDQVLYPEVTLRGLSTMIPGLKAYVGRMPRPFVDGGYYVKTAENRLLASPLPVKGAYVLGALSGYGMMASPAAGELVAAQVVGASLPDYAHWFSLDRYQDREYQALLENWGASGQL
jgi:glycine/D-amino acid oxidase-like deaminating enzyme